MSTMNESNGHEASCSNNTAGLWFMFDDLIPISAEDHLQDVEQIIQSDVIIGDDVFMTESIQSRCQLTSSASTPNAFTSALSSSSDKIISECPPFLHDSPSSPSLNKLDEENDKLSELFTNGCTDETTIEGFQISIDYDGSVGVNQDATLSKSITTNGSKLDLEQPLITLSSSSCLATAIPITPRAPIVSNPNDAFKLPLTVTTQLLSAVKKKRGRPPKVDMTNWTEQQIAEYKEKKKIEDRVKAAESSKSYRKRKNESDEEKIMEAQKELKVQEEKKLELIAKEKAILNDRECIIKRLKTETKLSNCKLNKAAKEGLTKQDYDLSKQLIKKYPTSSTNYFK